jgi:cAMP-dependent protein kinase regulator
MLKWLCEQTNDNNGGRGISTAEEIETIRKEIGRLKERKADLLGKQALRDGPAEDVMSDTTKANEEEEEEEDDEEVSDVMPDPPKYNRGPRQSVSAEAYGQWNQRSNFVAPVYEKSDEQKARIEKCLEPSFLFSGLEKQDLDTIVLACKEKTVDVGVRVIEQGDDGDSMFVIQDGKLDCLKKIDDEDKVVKTCAAGDVFGELALLYNCPRAASVECKERATLWELDRETFNRIVKDAAMRKRDIYSEFLRKVPLFANIDQYEMMTIADAVKVETHSQDECIIKQGDTGETFFIMLEGECIAKKVIVDGQPPQQVMTHQVGDHFGELALLRNEPRAASVYASSPHVKLLCLDRKTFKRLLGPLEDILRREAQRYEVPAKS